MLHVYTAIARDVYGKHIDELTPEQCRYLRTFLALRILEDEHANKKKQDG